jgi:hypothetical protein
MVKVGDSIPSIPLVENAPDNKVDLSKELASGKGLLIGVPAAFSMFADSITLHESQFAFIGTIGIHS